MPALVPPLLELEQARSLPAVGGVLRAAASPLGYDRLLVFATGTGLERDAQRVYWIEGDWFGDGSDTALARYLHACPVNRHVLDSNAPFFWSKRQGVRGERYQVVKQPRGDGLHGLQVPVSIFDGPMVRFRVRSVSPAPRLMHPPARACCWKWSEGQPSVRRASSPRRPRMFAQAR